MEENVRERDRLRASNQETEKIRLLFSRESESERVFSRVFGGEKQREAFEMVLSV